MGQRDRISRVTCDQHGLAKAIAKQPGGEVVGHIQGVVRNKRKTPLAIKRQTTQIAHQHAVRAMLRHRHKDPSFARLLDPRGGEKDRSLTSVRQLNCLRPIL